MHDNARRLVDDEEVLVLMAHFDVGDRLWLELRGGPLDHEAVVAHLPRAQLVSLHQLPTVDGYVAPHD